MWGAFKEGFGQSLGRSTPWLLVCILIYFGLGASGRDEIYQSFGRGYAAVTVACIGQ